MDCLRKNFVEGTLLNGRYETISPLNHGSFGMVIMARDRQTDNRVAIKCLTKPSATPDANCPFIVDDRSEELAIHSRAGAHPNIVNLIESFETETHIYLVLEYCSMGDLYEAIRLDKGPKKTDHVRDFMLQLVDAVDYLHSRGLYHRDIKPENIFLTENGAMKLGDFGLATTDSWSYEAAVGSDRYMAPEQYDPAGSGLSPAKADIWSIGICLLNILFSRNPFGTPSISDPLFADYVRDRQSLFDVFPNMSQDTYTVLIHSLAIDPEKRSLSMVKEALERVIIFTTDEDSLDEFCTEDRDNVPAATANREPLRTPSITSPNMSGGGNDTFPWAKALHMTSPQKVGFGRALSVIHDTDTPSEDLFPASEASTHDWFSKADTQSIESIVDSGLGVSISSSNFQNSPSPKVTRSKPMPIAGSLPSLRGSATSALASIFGGVGKKKQFESKSWSDLWEEEEEEQREMLEQQQKQKTMQTTAARTMPKIANLSQEDSEDDGRSTPRACLRELRNPVSMGNLRRPNSQDSIRSDGLDAHAAGEQSVFYFEDHSPTNNSTPRYSRPQQSSTKRTIIDKWAALGDRRRGTQNAATPTPAPTALASLAPTPAPASVTTSTPTKAHVTARDFSSPADPSSRRRFRASTWRRGMFNRQATSSNNNNNDIPQHGGNTYYHAQRGLDHGIWTQSTKEWSLSKDWRKSEQHLPLPSQPHASQLDGSSSSSSSGDAKEDVSVSSSSSPIDVSPTAADKRDTSAGLEDADFVGGWRELHI